MNMIWTVVLTAVLLQLGTAVVSIAIVAGWNVIAAVMVGVTGAGSVLYALRRSDLLALQIAGSQHVAAVVLKPAEIGPCEGVHPDGLDPPSARAA
jgi:hypothetical protein